MNPGPGHSNSGHRSAVPDPVGINAQGARTRSSGPLPFSVTVEAHPPHGWLVVINLGEWASVTKWFEAEEEAVRYPEELADWLSRGREE